MAHYSEKFPAGVLEPLKTAEDRLSEAIERLGLSTAPEVYDYIEPMILEARKAILAARSALVSSSRV